MRVSLIILAQAAALTSAILVPRRVDRPHFLEFGIPKSLAFDHSLHDVGISDIPNLADFPQFAGLASLAGLSNLPGLADMPSMSETPQTPGFPRISLPHFSKTPAPAPSLLDSLPENDQEISVSRVIRVPCEGCPTQVPGQRTDLVLEFNLAAGNHRNMTLNDIPILPISEDPLKPSELTNLVVTQMPSDVDSIVYIINPKMFPTVSLSYGLLTRVETKNDIKNYELILNIYSVNQTEVNLKGLEMTVNEEPGTHKLSFGPYVSLPKGEMCGMNLKCMMDKMFRKVQDMRIPLPSFTSMGCHEEISEEETGTPSIELGKATTVTTPVFSYQANASPKRPSLFHRIVRQILLPVFVGIAVGMAVSLLGLVIGHISVAIWRRFYGRSSGASRARGCFGFLRRNRERCAREARNKLAAGMADGEVEKALLPQTEAPPAYADDETVDAVEKE